MFSFIFFNYWNDICNSLIFHLWLCIKRHVVLEKKTLLLYQNSTPTIFYLNFPDFMLFKTFGADYYFGITILFDSFIGCIKSESKFENNTQFIELNMNQLSKYFLFHCSIFNIWHIRISATKTSKFATKYYISNSTPIFKCRPTIFILFQIFWKKWRQSHLIRTFSSFGAFFVSLVFSCPKSLPNRKKAGKREAREK